MNNKIVIILVNYNGYKDTKACLESIKLTKGDKPFIVLVDNASTEEKDLKNLNELYPRFKLIENTQNVGFGRANNIGIKWAQENIDFEYLLLLNNDTLIEPCTILSLIKAFQKDSTIGITTGKTLYEGNREIIWYGGGFINFKRGWPKIIDFGKKATSEGANKSKYITFISGCTMMFTKKSIEKLNGFDENFFMYCEDLELSMRAVKVGFKLWYCSDAIIYHKVQGSFSEKGIGGFNKNNKRLAFLFYHMKKNQWITMKKHLNNSQFNKFIFFYWSEILYRTVYFILWMRVDLIKVTFKILKDVLKYKNERLSIN